MPTRDHPSWVDASRFFRTLARFGLQDVDLDRRQLKKVPSTPRFDPLDGLTGWAVSLPCLVSRLRKAFATAASAAVLSDK